MSVPLHGKQRLTGRPTRTADLEALAMRARASVGGAGGRAALDALCEGCLRDVARILVHLGAGPGDLDDLVQTSMLQVCRSIGSFAGSSPFRVWLYGLCARVYLQHRRSHGRLRRAFERLRLVFDAPPVPTPLEQASEHEALDRIEDAVAHLGAKQRAVFVLREVEGLTCEEIAAALAIPVGTVWTRLHHARRDLVKRLGPLPRDGEEGGE